MDYRPSTAPEERVISFPLPSFDEKYPPDPFGEDASEHARVWKVYRDQMTEYEEKRLDGWNRALDILLIFAGLFSAVLTAFLIESYKTLTQDSADYMANLMYRVASAPGGPFPLANASSGPILPPGDGFSSALSARWVNGLWFASLVLTLGVALLSILAKQWLDEYAGVALTKRAPTAHHWTRRHALHSEGLTKWRVPFLISFLPSLLHLSLFLFFAGLALFLVPLDKNIAYVVAGIGGAALGFYLLQFVLPIGNTSCAFRSPLARQLRQQFPKSRLVRFSRNVFAAVVAAYPLLVEGLRERSLAKLSRMIHAAGHALMRPLEKTPTHVERTIERTAGYLDACALHWLVSSSTRSVAAIAIRAMGSIRPGTSTGKHLQKLDAYRPLKVYMSSRSQEVTDADIMRDDDAMWEHLYCLRAWITSGLTKPLETPSPFLQRMDGGLPPGDFRLINVFMSTMNSPEQGPMARISTLLTGLEEENVRHMKSLHPLCSRSTALLLIDAVSLSEPPFSLRDTLPSCDRRRRWAVTKIALLVNLVHLLQPDVLQSPGLETVKDVIRQWHDSSPVLQKLLPVRHLDIDAEFVVLATWLHIAREASSYSFSPLSMEVLGSDIVSLTNRFIAAYNALNGMVGERVLPSSDIFLDFLASDIFIEYPWSLHDIDTFADLFKTRHDLDPYSLHDARVESALVHLLRSAGRAEGDPRPAGGLCDLFRRRLPTRPSYGIPRFRNHSLLLFLTDGDDANPSAWQILHRDVCADGAANVHVFNIANILSADLVDRTTRGQDMARQVTTFFAPGLLGHCIRAVYSQWTGDVNWAVTDTVQWEHETVQETLAPSLNMVEEFIEACAKLRPRTTADMYTDLLDTSTSQVHIPGFIDFLAVRVHRRMLAEDQFPGAKRLFRAVDARRNDADACSHDIYVPRTSLQSFLLLSGGSTARNTQHELLYYAEHAMPPRDQRDHITLPYRLGAHIVRVLHDRGQAGAPRPTVPANGARAFIDYLRARPALSTEVDSQHATAANH